MTADPRTTFQSGAQKDLKGPRPALIPPNAMLEVAEVYGYGARKYTSRNWEAGLPFTDVLDASMRHLLKFLAGVDRDDESGLHHLAHSVFGLLSVLEYSLTESGEDDRTGLRPAAGVYTPPSLSVVESLQETPTKGTDMSDNKPTPEDLGYDDKEDLHMHIDAAAHQVRAALRILDITE